MSGIAAYINGAPIYWSAVTITLGLLGCLLLTLALYRGRSENSTAVWALFCLGFVLAVFFSRLLHWYFNSETYGSFAVALLLDCATPGMILLLAFIRLSALFNSTCRSRILITQKTFQHLPVAVSSTDASGNETWRLATFFISFILLMILFCFCLGFYFEKGRKKMKEPCARYGNVARLFLVYYGAIEIVMDSTRYDSPLMHFRFISYLNQYSAFISLAQVFAAATALGVLIYYSAKAIKGGFFRFYHPLLWILFLASLVGIGYLGEYTVQRTANYIQCYAFMSVSCLLMALSVFWAYLSCRKRRS